MLIHGEYVFKGERLKVQAVARIVVSRDRLRVTVHHDGLVAIFTQSEGGVAATVIELDSLPDAVRSRSEDDDLLSRRRCRLIFLVVTGVEIGCETLKLC